MYSGTHLAVNPHTVVSPYLRSRGISSRVACRNGGAVTNLWGVGTATAISDSESPIYIKNIFEYASFSASDPELDCISFCICVRPCLKLLHHAGKNGPPKDQSGSSLVWKYRILYRDYVTIRTTMIGSYPCSIYFWGQGSD